MGMICMIWFFSNANDAWFSDIFERRETSLGNPIERSCCHKSSLGMIDRFSGEETSLESWYYYQLYVARASARHWGENLYCHEIFGFHIQYFWTGSTFWQRLGHEYAVIWHEWMNEWIMHEYTGWCIGYHNECLTPLGINGEQWSIIQVTNVFAMSFSQGRQRLDTEMLPNQRKGVMLRKSVTPGIPWIKTILSFKISWFYHMNDFKFI